VPADNSMSNPLIPDRILPFKITKEEAIQKIEEYLKDKRKHARKEFLQAFNPDEIIPVYFPYMLVDIKAHSNVSGLGEVDPTGEVRRGKRTITVCNVKKEFDLLIDDLMIESNRASSLNTINTTNHVISAVSPFDTANCVEFNVNFLNGFSSENRDLDVVELNSKIKAIVEDISSKEVEKMEGNFNRGVLWDYPESEIIGTQWTSALLPVWIYSYYEKTTGVKYYIAVNGRTGKTIGSIPFYDNGLKRESFIKLITRPLYLIFLIAIILCFIPFLIALFANSYSDITITMDLLSSPFVIVGSVGLLLYVLFAFFKYYEILDDEREKYSSDKKNIDYITQATYRTNNIDTKEDIIDSYDTSKRAINNKNTSTYSVSIR
jgi:hypothetical protein